MKRTLMFVIIVLLVFSVVFVFVPQFRHREPIAYSFRLPLDGDWIVWQDFAEWNQRWEGYHLAEDVVRSSEVPVYASANGIVKHAALRGLGYGYVIVIEHLLPPGDSAGNLVCTVYGHLRKEGLASEGEVSKGDLIGYLSSNPEHNNGVIHLHFGIRKGPYLGLLVDPRRGRGWYYGGCTTIYGECNRDDPVHTEILAEWLNPTTDPINGEGFIEQQAH